MPFDEHDQLQFKEASVTSSPSPDTRWQPKQAEEPEVATSVLAVGTIIAEQYQILSLLGAGGMSQVYRCQDLRLDRHVAVKLLHLHQGVNSQAMLRFQREGKAIARLDHENIVKVFSLQEDDHHQPVMVMEVIDGVSLADLIEGGKQLPLPRVLKFVRQICDGLAHAHSQGVVHRDLKPSNIMLVNPGQANEQIKILDFGIAKVMADDSIKATQTGEIFGSPAYMSPEQSEGRSIDARTDQYSLGCVLFELLAGRPPFVAGNQIAVIVAHLHEQPPPLSKFRKHKIPQQMEETLMKLLAKDPSKRFASIEDVRSAFFPTSAEARSIQKSRFQIGARNGLVIVVSLLLLLASGMFINSILKGMEFEKTSQPKRTFNEADTGRSFSTYFEQEVPADIEFGKQIRSGIQDLKPDPSISNLALAPMDCMPARTSLDLSRCHNITDEGIESLHRTTFTRLWLVQTRITSKSMPIIGAMHTLMDLDLRETDVDDQASHS